MARIPRRVRAAVGVFVPAALLAIGLFVGTLQSTEWEWRLPLHSGVEAVALDPVRALPRTAAILAALDAQRHLDGGRPYAAWEAVQGHLDAPGQAGSTVNLVAARAAAEWGGWTRVRGVLGDRPWLASASAGEGLFLLGRAEEELGNAAPAAAAYRGYLSLDAAERRGTALARLGNVLSADGAYLEAAQAYEAAAGELGEIADWLRARQLQQLVQAGDPSAAEVAGSLSGGSGPARAVRAGLEARALVTDAQTDRAISRLEWEARILSAEGANAEAGQLDLERARLLLGSPTRGEGRALLQAIAADPSLPASTRVAAAERLGEQADRNAAEELARAGAFEAASRPGPAAAALHAALEAGAPGDGEVRFRLGRLLFDARDYPRARAAFQRAAELLEGREEKADAELYAARSLFRTGGSARASALADFRRVVERYEATAAAGTALFLLGDEAATHQAGLAYYRRAAEVLGSPDAREALYRVGDRSLRLKETAAAIRAWEQYVARYPRGDQTARVAYDLGKLHDSAGRRGAAREMFAAATLAEPTSYYAIRAAERIAADPLDRALAEPQPWVGLASEPAEAAEVLRRLDQLRSAGLDAERDLEYQAALRRFERQPVALLVLAEGLRDRHETIEAIGLGRDLLRQRDGEWDERLLRVVFPFPYRELIVDVAHDEDVDPFLYAGLVRQESAFRRDIKSRVGATGLGQIMPPTGRWLAETLGIRDYDNSLLEIPEVNLRMGTKYLGDLLTRYNGAADLALAGYNAGPSRADRWRRQFNYGRDVDAFREAIPFTETRGYVMIVLRNAAIYRRLYGRPAPTPLPLAD